MADDRWMWWASPPLSYPISEYTTPEEMRQERISQAFGWDTSRPGHEFLRRLPLLLQAIPVRSPMGARIGNDTAWAARTPSAITGGDPRYVDSSAGLAERIRAYGGNPSPISLRPGAEPPRLPPFNNNRPFLRREDQVVNPYDFAVAWQQAIRRSRQTPWGGRD
jgi:hypothetical protein